MMFGNFLITGTTVYCVRCKTRQKKAFARGSFSHNCKRDMFTLQISIDLRNFRTMMTRSEVKVNAQTGSTNSIKKAISHCHQSEEFFRQIKVMNFSPSPRRRRHFRRGSKFRRSEADDDDDDGRCYTLQLTAQRCKK